MINSSMLKSYRSSLILLGSLIIGALIGIVLGERAQLLKPFGDIFLNMLFTVVVPLVFFSIASAVAAMTDTRRLGRILSIMMMVFILTGIVASLIMVAGVLAFNPAKGLNIELQMPVEQETGSLGDKLVRAFTVSNFGDLLDRKNMLALIIIAMLTGLGSLYAGKEGNGFRQWLVSGNAVMMKVIDFIMLYAPIGLGAYFAYLTGVFGPQLLGAYGRAMLIYYPTALFYFFVFFSIYTWMAGGAHGMKLFWTNITPAALTAFATGSSVATIPANLEAARRNGVPEDIREVVIPIGSTIHMEGSCLSAILKTAVLFGIFGMEFSGFSTIAIAVGVALLSGTVMSGIPGGGFLGEMLIVSLYGFPPEALPVAAMIGTLVDPPATMLNSIGDNVSCMLIARVMGGKDWLSHAV